MFLLAGTKLNAELMRVHGRNLKTQSVRQLGQKFIKTADPFLILPTRESATGQKPEDFVRKITSSASLPRQTLQPVYVSTLHLKDTLPAMTLQQVALVTHYGALRA